MAATYQIALSPVVEETDDPRARHALATAKAQMGFVPNMYASMANAAILLDSYMSTYSLFRSASTLTPVEQEIVFLTASRENGCSYCMAAHSFVGANMTKVPQEIIQAIRQDGQINDQRLAALRTFVTLMVRSRGRPSTAEAKAFLDAGFTEAQMLEVVLGIAIKTMSNYANHLTNPKVDPVFSAYSWEAA